MKSKRVKLFLQSLGCSVIVISLGIILVNFSNANVDQIVSRAVPFTFAGVIAVFYSIFIISAGTKKDAHKRFRPVADDEN